MPVVTGKDGATIILFKDITRQEVFLIFRNDIPIWVTTGGGIEKGENPQKAAMREVFEESGFKVNLRNKVSETHYLNKRGKVTRKSYLYWGTYVSGTYRPEYPDNIGKWFPINRLPQDILFSNKNRIKLASTHHGKPILNRIEYKVPIFQNLLLILRHPFSLGPYFIKLFKQKHLSR